jgi:hypothetical protein
MTAYQAGQVHDAQKPDNVLGQAKSQEVKQCALL